MTQIFSNNAATQLAESIGMGTLTFTVTDGSAFTEPTGLDYELLTIHDATYSKWEVVSLDTRVGNTITVGRGIEGVHQTWDAEAYISANITKKTMEDLVSSVEATTLVANNAASDATTALAQIVTLQESGGSGGAMDRLDLEVYNVFATGDGIARSFYTIRHHRGFEDGLTINNDQAREDMVFPVPMLGYCRMEWNSVVVWRNGMLQQMFRDDNLNDWIDNQYELYFVQILGPRQLRFWPELQSDELITILAPRASWADEVKTGNSYLDEYGKTGVQYSYIAAGKTSLGVTKNYVHEFNWETFLTRVSSQAGTVGSNTEWGSGGVSDANGLIFFIGGHLTGRNSIYKLALTPSVTTIVYIGSGFNLSHGTTFTDEALAWIAGFGSTTTDTAMGVFNISTEATSGISTTVVGVEVKNITSFCNGTHGSIFNTYDASGVATEGQFQKFTCATEAITAPANMGDSKADGAAALLFRSGSAFIWNGTSDDTIYEWSIATETIVSVQGRMFSCSTYGDSAHQVVCDGEHQAQSMITAFMFSTVGAVCTLRHREFEDNNTVVDRILNPIGSATDYWSAC